MACSNKSQHSHDASVVRTSLDATGLLLWARSAAKGLARNRQAINDLNVFPIPDSDTGSNMAYTMESAVEAAQQYSSDAMRVTTQGIASSLAAGAARGARGNSGIVLSQVFRSLAESLVSTESTVTGEIIAHSFSVAVDMITDAFVDPVEGTALTVLREAAHAAQDALRETRSSPCSASYVLELVSEKALLAAREALKRTPSQLTVLHNYGVVDAGGAGLVVMLEALCTTITREETSAVASGEHVSDDDMRVVQKKHHDRVAAPCMEVMFELFTAKRLNTTDIQAALTEYGGSLALAPSSQNSATVHIHTHAPGEVLEAAYRLGTISHIRIEPLPTNDRQDAITLNSTTIVAFMHPGDLSDVCSAMGVVTVKIPHDDGVERRNFYEKPFPCSRIFFPDPDDITLPDETRNLLIMPNGFLSPKDLKEYSDYWEKNGIRVYQVATYSEVECFSALTFYDPLLDPGTLSYVMGQGSSLSQVFSFASQDNVAVIMSHIVSLYGRCAELVVALTDSSEKKSAESFLRDFFPQSEIKVFVSPGMRGLQVGIE